MNFNRIYRPWLPAEASAMSYVISRRIQLVKSSSHEYGKVESLTTSNGKLNFLEKLASNNQNTMGWIF